MSHSGPSDVSIVPARLEFLSIYSPDLADDDQLVFHYSTPKPRRRRNAAKEADKEATSKPEAEGENRKDEHRRMRQIGLAQGMVNFARSFAGTQDVDAIETEKNRSVVAELERGWWVLASIRLTRISTVDPSGESSQQSGTPIEYSSREVSPAPVLVQQLRRAYRIFKLHHTHTLSDLFVKLPRSRFCGLLERYWTRFALSWDVMLHDNPVLDAFDGIRLAGGGELGVGVGEEEYGSAEREYLEELVRMTDGLSDLLVYRSPLTYGRGPESTAAAADHPTGLAEGVIFSGVQSLAPDSIQAISEWLFQVGRAGSEAYGVTDNPLSSRNRSLRSQRRKSEMHQDGESIEIANDENKPTPNDQAGGVSLDRQGKASGARKRSIPPSLIPSLEASQRRHSSTPADGQRTTSEDKMDSGGWMNYLTLGYGSQWGGGTGIKKDVDPSTVPKARPDGAKFNKEPFPRFLVGWKGPLDDLSDQSDTLEEDINDPAEHSDRLSVRVVHVEAYEFPENVDLTEMNFDSTAQQEQISRRASEGKRVLIKKRLRTLVYQHHPFTFAFIFQPDCASLAMSSFYRELHQKLLPLHKALLTSTSAERIVAKLRAMSPHDSEVSSRAIFDVTHDPVQKRIRSSLAHIPSFKDDKSGSDATPFQSWSRLEALNVYTHLLSLISEQGSHAASQERSIKTTRNWWITWLKLPAETTPMSVTIEGVATPINDEKVLFKDAILVRKATERSSASRSPYGIASSFGRLSIGGGAAGLNRLIGREASSSSESSDMKQSDRSGLVQETAIDTRRYVEALFNINR